MVCFRFTDMKIKPFVAVLLCLFPPLAVAEWSQWRGDNRDGSVAGKDWPETLDETALKQLWRVEMGPGYSGPLVTEKMVITTETEDRQYELVRCLDRATGEEIWRARWEGAMNVPFFAKKNGDWIRATPALANGRLFVAGMKDVLVCLDVESGKEIWRRDFMEELGTPVPAFGFVSSPLPDGDALYIQAAGGVMKISQETGKTLWHEWKDGGGMSGSAFSSPVIAVLAGKRQLVVQAREKLGGLDLETGKVLWEQPVTAFRGMNILTPTVFNDGVFTTSYGGKGLMFGIGEENGQWKVTQRWTADVEGYMGSPVVLDGKAWLHLRNRRATCVDLADGKVTWTSDDRFGEYWSIVTNGKRLLALDQTGELLLIDPSDPASPKILSRRPVGSESWAHVVVDKGQIIVRELKAVTVYDWK
jgi:outer membrane protein assembly factor BamB